MAWNRVDDGEQYEAARRLNAEAGRTWTVMWAPGLRAYVAFYQGTAAVRWQGSPTAEGLMERLREAERGLRAGPGGSRAPERGGGDGPRAGGAHRRRDAAPVPDADTVSGVTAAVSAPTAPVAADAGTARSRALMRRPAPVPVPAPAAVPGGTGAPGARSDDSGLRAATSSGDGSRAAGGFAATAPGAVAVDGGDLARAGESGRTSRRGGDTRTGNASGSVRTPVRTRTGEGAGHGGADHVIETAPGTARATFVPAGGGTGAGPWSATTRLRGPRPGARAVVIPGEPVADGYWTCPAQGCSWTSINPMSHPCPVGGQSRARGRGHGRSPARIRGEFGVEGALRAGPAS